jgi:hypothetical protein
MEEYKAGTAIRFDAEVKDNAGDYVDPSTIKIQFVVEGADYFSEPQDMTQDVTGKYYYIFQSLTPNN